MSIGHQFINSLDLTGKKFSRLTAISISYNKLSVTYWNCVCDCGKNTVVKCYHLLNKNTRSCGCLDTHDGRLSDETLASKHVLYNRYKKTCAKERGHSFSLNLKEFFEIAQQNCYYCGVPPSRYCMPKNAIRGIFYNGLDRVDNNLGYYIGNVVPCCKECNYAKTDRTQKDFIQWVGICYNNLNLGNL